jgi:pimeloyl-ACP methyl ester carboxylesterase
MSMAPTVVLLHAFPLNKSLFDGVTAQIADAGWDVIVPDLRGFGESGFGGVEPDDEPSLTFMARDVLDIMDRVGVQSAVIAGVSLGGYVAMELVRQAPERIAALALIDTKGSADSAEARENRLRVAQQVSEAESTQALARAMLPNLVGSATHEHRPEVVELVRGWILAADPEGVAWAQRAMAARPDSHGDLAALRVPSLVLWGAQDALSPRADQDALVAALTDVRAIELPDAGHLTPIEVPDQFADAFITFLTDARTSLDQS